jgi:regulator of protease activity HflC (stomatin/prohibitin superfamily)
MLIKSFIILALIQISIAFFTSVPSGYRGVYIWMGRIQPQLVNGTSAYNPFFSDIKHVKVIQDTDILNNVKCVSKEGVNIEVPSIEIANRINPEYLISTIESYGFDYDTKLVLNPLGQRMRELCAARTVDEIEIHDFHKLDNLLLEDIQKQVDEVNSGITIDWVRITNVLIPNEIKQKRLLLAAEKANKIHVEEVAKRTAVEKQIEATVQEADNKRKLAEQDMQNQKTIMIAEANRTQEEIYNQMMINATRASAERTRIESFAEADKRRVAAQAEADQIRTLSVANAERMSREAAELQKFYSITGYAEVQKVQALSGNTKVFFGDNLPGNMFLGSPGVVNAVNP